MRLRDVFSIAAAYQHIEHGVTFHHSLGFRARELLWLPFHIAAYGLWFAFTAALLPLGFLMLSTRLLLERKKP